MKKIVVCCLLAVSALFMVNCGSNEKKVEKEEKVVKEVVANKKKVLGAYLPIWKKWTADQIQGEKLTHVHISFVKVDPKTFAITWEDKTDKMVPGTLEEIAKLQKKFPNLKVAIAVGGWGADHFSDMAMTPETRKVFIDSVIKLVKDMKLDGVTMDWEFPVHGAWGTIKARPEDKQNFTAVMQGLRTELDKLGETTGKKYEISYACNINQWAVDNVEIEKLIPIVDHFDIMAYDYAGGWMKESGHASNMFKNPNTPEGQPFYTIDGIAKYLAAGVPAEKLVIGFAAYGKDWVGIDKGEIAELPGLYGKRTEKEGALGNIAYKTIKDEYLNKEGYTRYWDDAAKMPYLYNGDHFITYDDAESIRHKAKYILENNIGGMMYWEYVHDIDGDLLTAANEALNK